ncbi:MAG TPA: S8 family serine peptidase, partial [Catalimonadaceae bacterium]|nr:S8 family serine peptidase [Catalimonadaceae bacterium]
EEFRVQFKNGSIVPKAENQNLTQNLPQFEGRRYGLIQFFQIPNEDEKKQLEVNGVELLDYVPNLTWVFSTPTGVEPALLVSGIRAIFPLNAENKQDEAVLGRKFPQWAVKESGKVDLVVILVRKQDMNQSSVFQRLTSMGAKVLSRADVFQNLTIRLDESKIAQLAEETWLQWMEPISPTPVKENLPGKNLHRSNVLNDGIRNLTGDNVKVGVWDGGEVGKHLDFTGRLSVEEFTTPSDHGTHCAGTIGGAGIIDPSARGMAPKSLLYSYDFFGDIPTEMNAAVPAKGLIITSNSYGYGDAFVNCTNGDPYNSNSRSQDLVTINFPNLVHVHSAGNSQAVCAGGWKTTTGKSAKNVLVVANVTTNEAISS